MVLLIILLVVAIFLYKTKIENQLIEDKSPKELNADALSNTWLWVIIGLGLIILLLLFLMLMRSPQYFSK